MGFETTLTKATTASESLRTTVPSGIVIQFGLKEGDVLDWTITVKNGKLILEVIPKRGK